jgi:hypothetical protein
MSEMSEMNDNNTTSERAAAEAERRAAPVPAYGGAATAHGPERDPSMPLRTAPFPGIPEGQRGNERISPGVKVAGSLLGIFGALVALGALFLGVIQGMAWLAQPARVTQTQAFTVGGTPTLVLDISAANVKIVPGTSGQIGVALTKEARAVTHGAAQQAVNDITLDTAQSGDTVHVGIHEPGFGQFPQVVKRQVELSITVPASTNLDLELSAGNAEVSGLTGTLQGHMSAGNLDLRDMTVTGDSSLHMSAASMTYDGSLASGASFEVSMSAGNLDITLPRATATHVEASATAGNVDVSGWSGIHPSRQAGESSLSADLNPNPTSTLSIQVSAGNVTLRPGA